MCVGPGDSQKGGGETTWKVSPGSESRCHDHLLAFRLSRQGASVLDSCRNLVSICLSSFNSKISCSVRRAIGIVLSVLCGTHAGVDEADLLALQHQYDGKVDPAVPPLEPEPPHADAEEVQGNHELPLVKNSSSCWLDR